MTIPYAVSMRTESSDDYVFLIIAPNAVAAANEAAARIGAELAYVYNFDVDTADPGDALTFSSAFATLCDNAYPEEEGL